MTRTELIERLTKLELQLLGAGDLSDLEHVREVRAVLKTGDSLREGAGPSKEDLDVLTAAVAAQLPALP